MIYASLTSCSREEKALAIVLEDPAQNWTRKDVQAVLLDGRFLARNGFGAQADPIQGVVKDAPVCDNCSAMAKPANRTSFVLRKVRRKLATFVRQPFRVICLNCGCLAYFEGGTSHEVPADTRILLGLRGEAGCPSEKYLDSLDCCRSLWPDLVLGLGTPLFDIVNDRRHCKGFLKHKPGFSPEQHLANLTKSEDRGAQFRQTVLAAFVGSILALVAQWIAPKLLGINPPSVTSQVPKK